MTKEEAAIKLVEMCCILSRDYNDDASLHEAVAIACAALYNSEKEGENDA